jgi:DNA-binding SARP family transcriptional activator
VLEFRILGPLEVTSNGDVVSIRGQKLRAALALLLVRPNEVVSTGRMIDALWGERAPRTAQTSLQNFISQLRKVLGSHVVETLSPGYRIRIEPNELDLGRFELLVGEARGRPADERVHTFREALALWRGPPLADFPYEAWAQDEIRRLDALRLTATEELFEAELEVGRHVEILPELESLVSKEPFQERLRSQLMLALYRSGRQADALQHYHALRRLLADEVAIEPTPELQRLYTKILRQEAGLELDARTESRADSLLDVAKAMLAGRLVPLLGADVSELAGHLAAQFGYSDGALELPRVSQYVAIMKGSGPLYDELHAALAGSAAPTAVHRFFASLPPALREAGAPHQLIVTTSYDLALEEAFLEAGEEFDVVWYVASGPCRGRFCHLAPDGDVRLIELPNTYTRELSLVQRTIILKLHGRVDLTASREWESFVVTEDDYIDFLAQNELANVVPVGLAATIRRSHFLFLGYAMRDWNLRVILNRLWRDDALSYRSWAVHPRASALERAFWRTREVEMIDADVEAYLEGLSAQLAALVPAATP